MNNESFEVQLSHQTQLIISSIISLEYLINFPNYLKEIDNDKPKDLWYIYNVIRDNTILNLTKLYHGKEDYSINKLSQLLLQVYEKNDSKIIEFFRISKLGNKLFNKLKILDIRNEHVGHLLTSRSIKTIDWMEVQTLIDIACQVHNHVNQMIFKQKNHWELEKDILNRIFSKDLLSKKLYKSWRNMYHEDKLTIDREEISKLLKTSWPQQNL